MSMYELRVSQRIGNSLYLPDFIAVCDQRTYFFIILLTWRPDDKRLHWCPLVRLAGLGPIFLTNSLYKLKRRQNWSSMPCQTKWNFNLLKICCSDCHSLTLSTHCLSNRLALTSTLIRIEFYVSLKDIIWWRNRFLSYWSHYIVKKRVWGLWGLHWYW